MKTQTLITLLKLRFIVGALGERQTPPLWTTNFAAQTSEMFLKPIFSKTYFLAEYQGLKEAACLVHDRFIGTGNVYHLFRLPENMEYELQNLAISQPAVLSDLIEASKAPDTLISELRGFSGTGQISASGPISIGKPNELTRQTGAEKLAQYYLSAFSSNVQVFPYFTD